MQICNCKIRAIEKVVYGKTQAEGNGARVRRIIGGTQLTQFDPFLLLDHAIVKPPAGFPDHPHRGFETVTYCLSGSFKHEDFAKNKKTLEAGDLQWMTAGRGVKHCEIPGPEGGEGLQLWVNLSKEFKMVSPAYQDVRKKHIPIAKENGVTAVVIAGECLGVQSKVRTRTPAMYLDISLEPGAKLLQPVPSTWNACCYVLLGKVSLGPVDQQQEIISNYCAIFKLDEQDCIFAENTCKELARFILLAGQPINEPVVKHGPFVMNSQDEITQAISDYSNHANGFERASGWTSEYLKKQNR